MIDGYQTVKDAFRGEFFEPLVEAVSDLRQALDIGIFGGNIAYMVKRREFQRGDIGFFGAECFKAEVKDKIREAGIHLIFQEGHAVVDSGERVIPAVVVAVIFCVASVGEQTVRRHNAAEVEFEVSDLIFLSQVDEGIEEEIPVS